jgi:hypothetical protein
MLRRPLHLVSLLSLLICVAAGLGWYRASAGRPGDYLGWKRQQGEGKKWAQEEWSAQAHQGKLQLVYYRRTPAAFGETGAKTLIRSTGDNGFFWTAAKTLNENIVKRVSPASQPSTDSDADSESESDADSEAGADADSAATADADSDSESDSAAASTPASEPMFTMIDETTNGTRSRGMIMPLWLLTAVTGLMPLRWTMIAAKHRGDGHAAGDSVPKASRLFGSLASVCLLLAIGMGVLWLKSWYVGDRVSWRDAKTPQFIDLHSGKGQFVAHYRSVSPKLVNTAADLATAPNGVHWRQDADASVGYTPKNFCFEHDHQVSKQGESRSITFAAPYWSLIVLALLPPTWWLRNQKYGRVKPMSFGSGAMPRVGAQGVTFIGNRPI